MTTHQKPVQLQLNNTGAWKTIVTFDCAIETTVGQVMEAAITLQEVDPRAKFRISTKESQIVLMHLDKGEWRKA